MRPMLLLGVTLTLAACGRNEIVNPPPGHFVTVIPPAPIPPPSGTISGDVYEHTPSGPRPAAGITMTVITDLYSTVTTSDANGRYSTSVQGSWVIIEPVETSGYMSPCPSGTVWLWANPNRTINVDIVSKAVLSTTGVPDSYPISAIAVSGAVVEPTFDGPRPVAGASLSLGFEPYDSKTLSDALGRYVICTAPPGTGTDQQAPLNVTKDGYFPTSLLVIGGYGEKDTVQLLRSR